MKEEMTELTIKIPFDLLAFLNRKAYRELREVDKQIVWELMNHEDFKLTRRTKSYKSKLQKMEGVK